MASYGNTVLTSAGIDLVKRAIAKTATFEITRVATSSDSRLTNATISTIEALTTMSSVQQTGKVTAFDTSNSKQVGLKCEFTNQGLTDQYNICGVGIYAKEAGKSEILFAVAPAKEPETMPAKPNDQSALFAFSLNMYVVVGQASSMSITATTEGVVKSINSTIKPDANGNVTISYYSQAEVDQKISSLSSRIDSLNGSKTSNMDFNALKNRVAANESGKADKTSVYDKGTADGRYLQRDASTTLKSGSVLRWDDSGHANDDNNVPYTAGGLCWSGKTDSAEIRAEETAQDNLDLVFDLGDDGSNNVDFRWNNVSKAKINSSGKFTGHVDWANVDGKDTYSRAEIDSKVNAAKAEASAKADQVQNNVNGLSSKVSDIQVGGKNLLRNTRALDSNVWINRDAWPTAGYYKDCQIRQSNTTQWNGLTQYIEVREGEDYVFSVDVRSGDGATHANAARFYIMLSQDKEGSYTKAISHSDNQLFTYTPAWKRLSFQVKIESNGYVKPRIERMEEAGGMLQFARPKFEKGNIPTDWTPAPEDLEDVADAALNGLTETSKFALSVSAKADSNANSIQALDASKVNKTDFNALTNRVAANESSKADKTSVYDKGTADGRYLQRDASTTLKSGSVLRWDDSGHANDDNNVPYTAGGLCWSGKTDSAEIRAEETAQDNLDLVFDLGDDGSNNVDFRWNNVSKAKINSSGKFTGHVDWANVDGKDTYSRAEIDTKLSAKADTTSVKATADSLNTSITNAQDDIGTLQHRADSITNTLSKGGVNLLPGTRDFSWPQSWWAISGVQNQSNQYNSSEKVTEHKIVITPDRVQGIWWSGNNTVGQTYTLSFDARCDNGKAKIYQMGLEGNFLVDAALTTDWTRYHVSGKVTTGNQNWVTYFSTTGADTVYSRKYQIEYGEIATPWKPSNGDIGNLQQAADKLQSDLTNTKGAISSLDAKMPQAAYVPTVLTNDTDLNSMKTCGFYMVQGGTSNSPISGWIYVKVMGIPNRLHQFVWHDLDPAQQWCRLFDGNNWTPWTHYTQAI